MAGRRTDPRLPTPRFDWAVLAAVAAVSLALRAWALYIRATLDYDETYYYILARNLFTGKGYSLNGLPHTAFPPLYPVFVGLTSLFTSNVRLATSAISAIAGALLPVPVYFLAREIYDRRTALIAAASSAVWPALFFHAGLSVPGRLRMYAGSEPLFVTLFGAAVLFLYLAARRDGLVHCVLSGAFWGLALLTRNEALLFFGFLFAWFVVDRILFSSLAWIKRVLQSALLMVSFLVVVFPLVLYIHSVSGQWGLGAKLSNFVRIRPTLWASIELGKGKSFMKVHYAANDDATQMLDEYWGVSAWHKSRHGPGGIRDAVELVKNPDLRWLPVMRESFTDTPVPLVPRWMWFFLALGALVPPWRPAHRSFVTICAVVVLALIVQAVTVYVSARFELPVLPLLAVLAARGIERTAAFVAFVAGVLTGKMKIEAVFRVAVVALALAAMAAAGIQINRAGSRHVETRDALYSYPFDVQLARELRRELPAGATLMCHRPWMAVLAGLEWRVAPNDTPDRVLAYALARRIDYAILAPRQAGRDIAGTPLASYMLREVKSGTQTLELFDFTKAANAHGPSNGGDDAPLAPAVH